MRPVFEAKGGVPAWKRLYDAFHARNYGDKILQNEIQSVLIDYKEWRGPIYKFIKVLEENDQKTLKIDRDNGYIIAQPREHTELCKERVLRGKRQVVKGKHTLESTNVHMLTSDERLSLTNMEVTTNRILIAMRKRIPSIEPEKVRDETVITENLVDIENRLKRIQNLVKKRRSASSSA